MYVGDVAWTLRVRAQPGRHADSQSPRYTYTNPGTALVHWNRQCELGKTFDPSAGFTLDTGAMLSPDANWIAWDN